MAMSDIANALQSAVERHRAPEDAGVARLSEFRPQIEVYFPTRRSRRSANGCPASCSDPARSSRGHARPPARLRDGRDQHQQRHLLPVCEDPAVRARPALPCGGGNIAAAHQSGVGWLLLSTMEDGKIDNIVRRANIATEKRQARHAHRDHGEGAGHPEEGLLLGRENIPFVGGGTICVLLPVTIQNQPVAAGSRRRAREDPRQSRSLPRRLAARRALRGAKGQATA